MKKKVEKVDNYIDRSIDRLINRNIDNERVRKNEVKERERREKE